jgi:hypothetical protein
MKRYNLLMWRVFLTVFEMGVRVMETWKQKNCWQEGSYTVEAALTVPFGFLVLLSLSCLFVMLLHQNQIQMGMVRAVQNYGCTNSTLASLELLGTDGVILRWEDTADGKICYVDRRETVPFLGLSILGLHQYQQMVASDYSGVSMVGEDSGEETVYVAANGKVYHGDRDCTYLRTRIQNVTVNALNTKRNQSGGIYYPCESCCHSQAQDGTVTVYITSYGDRYHKNRQCSKLKRTVREVSRSKVGNLPACSKCGQ